MAILCFFMLEGYWFKGFCYFQFWKQPHAPTSKNNGKTLENKIENEHPKMQASGNLKDRI